MTLALVSDNSASVVVPDFDRFWAAYPRKIKKGDAVKAWHQVRTERPQITEILQALDAAKRSEQWRKDGGQFIPYPASWLRAWGWADEYEIDLPPQQQWEKENKKWYETASGIEAKGKELGLYPHQFEGWPLFKRAVLEAVK